MELPPVAIGGRLTMAKSKTWKEGKEKRDGGAFLALPFVVLNSAAFTELPGNAVKLLLDLCAQFKGENNGRLACPFSQMQVRGWRSEETLATAKKHLLESGLIVETRKGARPNKVSWYAVTWLALDWHQNMDIAQCAFPRGAYRLKDPLPATAKNGGTTGRKNAPLTPKTVAASAE